MIVPQAKEDMQNNNSERDYSDFSSIWNNDDDDLIEGSEEGADQLWFDTWEGQIELSTNPKIEDEFEDDFDEWRVYSPLERVRGTKSSLLRSASLPQRHSNNAQNNRFHSAHTLFWDLHYDEDVREQKPSFEFSRQKT